MTVSTNSGDQPFFDSFSFRSFFFLLICFFALWRFSLALYCFPTDYLQICYQLIFLSIFVN